MSKESNEHVSAEELARMADQGQDISAHFTNQFTVVRPSVQRVNVDFTTPMLKELDSEAETLNISRQTVIKAMLREALDHAPLHSKPAGAEAAVAFAPCPCEALSTAPIRFPRTPKPLIRLPQ